MWREKGFVCGCQGLIADITVLLTELISAIMVAIGCNSWPMGCMRAKQFIVINAIHLPATC